MKIALSLISPLCAVAILAGCSSEPAEQPAEPVDAAATEPAEPTMSAPDEEVFSQVFAAACPDAEPVATSMCRSMGMGESDFACEYGLGEDAVLRHDAMLTPVDGEWTLVDPETTCTQ